MYSLLGNQVGRWPSSQKARQAVWSDSQKGQCRSSGWKSLKWKTLQQGNWALRHELSGQTSEKQLEAPVQLDQAAVPQASHLPRPLISHTSSPHRSSVSNPADTTASFSDLGEAVDHQEYRQDGGSDSRVLDGEGAEPALLTRSWWWCLRAGLNKKGLEMSMGWAGWSAKSRPPSVHCLVLSQASLFECAVSLPTISPFCLENSWVCYWHSGLGHVSPPKIFTDPLLLQVDLGEMILSCTSILNFFCDNIYLSLRGLGTLWKLHWVCLLLHLQTWQGSARHSLRTSERSPWEFDPQNKMIGSRTWRENFAIEVDKSLTKHLPNKTLHQPR